MGRTPAGTSPRTTASATSPKGGSARARAAGEAGTRTLAPRPSATRSCGGGGRAVLRARAGEVAFVAATHGSPALPDGVLERIDERQGRRRDDVRVRAH